MVSIINPIKIVVTTNVYVPNNPEGKTTSICDTHIFNKYSNNFTNIYKIILYYLLYNSDKIPHNRTTHHFYLITKT